MIRYKQIWRKIKMAGNIEFVQGQESHSSSWGKYYVKGLEKWEVKEDFPQNKSDKHHSYQGYVCLDVPSGTMFSIFERFGSRHGADCFEFMICVVDQAEIGSHQGGYPDGFCKGNFKIIVEAKTKTLAPRLMGWWIDSADKSLAFAQHCAEHINKRGLKNLPAIA
jgi:hypothetical protein